MAREDAFLGPTPGEVPFHTPNGVARPSGQRPVVAITGEKSKNAPQVNGGNGVWAGNRTGE